MSWFTCGHVPTYGALNWYFDKFDVRETATLECGFCLHAGADHVMTNGTAISMRGTTFLP